MDEHPFAEVKPSIGFDAAILHLKSGGRVKRDGWNGKGMHVELQTPDADSKMTLPYLFLVYPQCETYPQGAKVPWLASQTDLLAGDWVLL